MYGHFTGIVLWLYPPPPPQLKSPHKVKCLHVSTHQLHHHDIINSLRARLISCCSFLLVLGTDTPFTVKCSSFRFRYRRRHDANLSVSVCIPQFHRSKTGYQSSLNKFRPMKINFVLLRSTSLHNIYALWQLVSDSSPANLYATNGTPRRFCMQHLDFFSKNFAKLRPWQNTV